MLEGWLELQLELFTFQFLFGLGAQSYWANPDCSICATNSECWKEYCEALQRWWWECRAGTALVSANQDLPSALQRWLGDLLHHWLAMINLGWGGDRTGEGEEEPPMEWTWKWGGDVGRLCYLILCSFLSQGNPKQVFSVLPLLKHGHRSE